MCFNGTVQNHCRCRISWSQKPLQSSFCSADVLLLISPGGSWAAVADGVWMVLTSNCEEFFFFFFFFLVSFCLSRLTFCLVYVWIIALLLKICISKFQLWACGLCLFYSLFNELWQHHWPKDSCSTVKLSPF